VGLEVVVAGSRSKTDPKAERSKNFGLGQLKAKKNDDRGKKRSNFKCRFCSKMLLSETARKSREKHVHTMASSQSIQKSKLKFETMFLFVIKFNSQICSKT
jgi:hypothetical protein